MKTLSCRSFLAIFLLAIASPVFANEFKSVVIGAGDSKEIPVTKHEVLRIRNFTQETGPTRGIVTVANDTGTATVLVASLLDKAAATAEPINSIVIAGPATVTVSAVTASGDVFVTYRKEADFD